MYQFLLVIFFWTKLFLVFYTENVFISVITLLMGENKCHSKNYGEIYWKNSYWNKNGTFLSFLHIFLTVIVTDGNITKFPFFPPQYSPFLPPKYWGVPGRLPISIRRQITHFNRTRWLGDEWWLMGTFCYQMGLGSGTSFQIFLGWGQMPSPRKIEFLNVFYIEFLNVWKRAGPPPQKYSRNFEWYF